MARKDIVVVGASSGGIDVLRMLAAALPSDFSGTLFVVVHLSPDSPGILDEILRRAGPLPASMAHNGERIRPGHIYLAPPDHHLLLEPGIMRVTKGPKENRFRPAIDPLFRSAAQVYGPRAVGVILTGNLDDGTAGLWAIKQLGGTAIVQDPEEAVFPSMPANALRYVDVDHCVPASAIGPLLVAMTTSEAETTPASVPPDLAIEVRIAMEENVFEAGVERLGQPSTFACPECHGVLMQLQEGGRVRFRCHTGHAYSAESLLTDITENLEDSLWSAIRSAQESIMLMRHLASHLRRINESAAAARFEARAEAEQQRADALRDVVMSRTAEDQSKSA